MYTIKAAVLPCKSAALSKFTKEELAYEYQDKIMAILSNQHSALDYLDFGYQINQVIEEAQDRGISEKALKVASGLLKVA